MTKNKESYAPDIIATSKLAQLDIAATNYTIGDKQYFTYDEALQIEKALEHTGWRLPTRSEWVLIAEEFGQRDGELYGKTLAEALDLPMMGWQNEEETIYENISGYYWSSTTPSAPNAYYLGFNASNVYPADSGYRYDGIPVRLVRDHRETENVQ